jgi:hypothetical protein
MWTCKTCGEKLEDQFQSCWKCTSPREPGQPAETPAEPGAKWKLSYRMFRGTLATWDELFTKAAYCATEIGPERVLNISHSVDDGDGVVTIWYWENESESTPDTR